MNRTRFAPFALGVLAYSLPVIVWGAYVRASKSGDGCGAHWPLCDGQFLPNPDKIQRVIEFSHRLMSGLLGLLVVGLVVWAFRLTRRPEDGTSVGRQIRFGAISVGFFTVTEALIGRALVKYGWVADNDSVHRAVAMSGHLVNTFLLVASLALTARIAATQRPLHFRGQKVVGAAIGVALAGMLLLGVSGAIAALGDTLFPSRSLAEGLSRDFSPTAHFLIRLRLLHPFLAVSVGVYLVFLAGMLSRLRPAPDVRRFAVGIGGLFAVELGLGVLNVGLLAPIWMQLIHLLVADLLWMQLVLLVLAALAVPVPQNPFRLADDSPLRDAPGRAGV